MDRNEAIRIVRMCCPKIANSKCDFETAMRVLVPELKESEDERIRKAILELVKQSSHILNPMNQKSMIAWLEKQGKQNPVLPGFEEQEGVAGRDYIPVEWVETIENYGKWKIVRVNEQNLAWSEEDENKKSDAITAIDLMMTDSFKETHPNLYKAFGESKDWLKTLKERCTLRPSDEQMKQLGLVVERNKDTLIGEGLMTLFNDLKNLKG